MGSPCLRSLFPSKYPCPTPFTLIVKVVDVTHFMNNFTKYTGKPNPLKTSSMKFQLIMSYAYHKSISTHDVKSIYCVKDILATKVVWFLTAIVGIISFNLMQRK